MQLLSVAHLCGLVCVVIMWVWQPASAQNNDAQLKRATAYIQNAENFYAKAEYDASIREYQFAANIYRAQNENNKYAVCYNGIGNNNIYLSRYQDAHTEFNRVLTHYKEQRLVDSSFVVDSTLVADAYEGLGRYFTKMNVNYDTAMVLHRHALSIRLRVYGERHPKIALSYYFIGQCYRGFAIDSLHNPIALELEYLQKALDLQLATVGEKNYQTADTYQALSDYYYDVKHDQQKGYEYQQKALAIREKLFDKNHPYIASSYLDLAKYHRLLGEYEQELDYLEKALAIQQVIFGDAHRNVALNLAQLAHRYRSMGDVERGLSYYEHAQRIFMNLLGEQSSEIAETYVGISQCYHDLDRYDDEFSYLKKALAIRQKIYGAQHFQTGNSLAALGTYFLGRNKGDSALVYYDRAIAIWKKQLGENHYLVADGYDKLAKAYGLLNNTDREFYYLNEALNKKKTGGNTSTTRSLQGADLAEDMGEVEATQQSTPILLYESYLNLARFYQRRKDYKLALGFCQNALSTVCQSVASQQGNWRANPTLKDLSSNIEWLEAINLKADLFLHLYQTQPNERKDLEFSIQTFELAMSLIDTLRTNFTSDGSKEQLTRRSIPVYEGALDAYYTFYALGQNSEALEKAFMTMERSKAFVLLQAIQNSQAKGAGIVPLELLKREELLRRNLAYYSDFKNRQHANAAEFDQAYFNTKRAYDSLIRDIETNYPRYYQLKYNQNVASISEIQKVILNQETALLEYFVGDKNMYVFRIEDQKRYLFKVPIDAVNQSNINLLRNNLTNYKYIGSNPKQAYSEYIRLAFLVYSKFVAPYLKDVPESVTRFTVIPDGMLSYVPFEILLTQAAPEAIDKPSYRDLSYLFTKYEINYSYSATLLVQNHTQQRRVHNARCIGFAPTYGKNDPLNADLPWTEQELKAVGKAFKGEYYFGTNASKELFLQQAANYGIIHLAMHGVVNWRNSQKSYLAFAPVASDSTHEAGNLYNYEIQNMVLNADLVVLSACETGYGKVIRGEGVLSLARGFMYAGAPSVVTTLWQVNDYTSSTLMMYFYHNLASGMTKPEALRKAKLSFLQQSDEISGHPAFWASFVTIGDPRPVQMGWSLWAIAAFGVGGAGAFLGLLYWWRRRRARRKGFRAVTISSWEDA